MWRITKFYKQKRTATTHRPPSQLLNGQPSSLWKKVTWSFPGEKTKKNKPNHQFSFHVGLPWADRLLFLSKGQKPSPLKNIGVIIHKPECSKPMSFRVKSSAFRRGIKPTGFRFQTPTALKSVRRSTFTCCEWMLGNFMTNSQNCKAKTPLQQICGRRKEFRGSNGDESIATKIVRNTMGRDS